jgi:hypothetical protein
MKLKHQIPIRTFASWDEGRPGFLEVDLVSHDGGSEFINNHLRRYCQQEEITFTRSRPYRKNDACFVEQKNWHVVRRTVGYVRYDTEEELTLLNELYSLLRLMTNFFSPQMKLREKTRDGSRVTKRYDQAKTPYQRLQEAGALTQRAEERLGALYLSLNPAQLQRKIGVIQKRLRILAVAKLETMRKEAIATEDLEHLLAEATIPEVEYILR